MTDILAGRYDLGAELGAGGMASVREAYDRTLARRVAIKLLHSQTLSQPGMRERFLREARAAASFHHPHAVATYDTGSDDGIPYIVMELVEGRTLADVLADRGALRPAEGVAVASHVLAALGAAHRRGLVHRDVKPGNVLLPGGQVPDHPNGDPPAKLADFGIARGLEEAAAGLTATGQVMGTPKYVSPEQVSGQPATPRSDVYSVGVMLYEMLAGRPPFEAESALALALAHREDPVPRLERRVRGLDRDVAQIVHRALEKDPARRFADANEMRAALLGQTSAMAASAPTVPTAAATAPVPTGAHRAEQPRAPWRPVAVVAVLALLLLALVAMDWSALFDRFASPGPGDDPGEEEPPPPADTEDPDPDPTDPAEEEPDPETEEPTEEEPPPDDPGNGDPGNGNGDPGNGDPGDGDGNPDPPGQEDPSGDGGGDSAEGEAHADPQPIAGTSPGDGTAGSDPVDQ